MIVRALYPPFLRGIKVGSTEVFAPAKFVTLKSTDGSITFIGDNGTNKDIDLAVNPSVLSNSFSIMQTDLGTYPTADNASDTLTFTSSDNSVDITGNSATDTIDLKTFQNIDGGNAASVYAPSDLNVDGGGA